MIDKYHIFIFKGLFVKYVIRSRIHTRIKSKRKIFCSVLEVKRGKMENNNRNEILNNNKLYKFLKKFLGKKLEQRIIKAYLSDCLSIFLFLNRKKI